MKRRHRFLRRLVIAAGVMAAIALILYAAVLPAIARHQVEDILANFGATHADFDVRSVSLRRLQLGNVDLGRPNWLEVDDIQVNYSLTSVWSGRVGTIEIKGALWRVRVRDGMIDFGIRSDGDSSGSADVPFDQLLLRDSALIFEWDGRATRIPLEATITRKSSGNLEIDMSWQAQTGISLPWHDLTATGFAGDLNLRAELKPDELQLHVLTENMVRAKTFQIRHRQDDIECSPIQLLVSQLAPKPLLRVIYRGDEAGWSLDAGISTVGSVSAGYGAHQASFERLSARLALAGPRSQAVSVDAEIEMSHAAFTSTKAGLSMRNVSATIPVSLNHSKEGGKDEGRFAIESIDFRGESLPGMTGTLDVENERIQARATWPFMTGAIATASAWMDMGGHSRGQLTVTVPPFEITDSKTISKLVPQLHEVSIGGTWRADASIDLDEGRIKPQIRIVAEDASFANASWPGEIKSASGSIVINGLAPLSLAGTQRIEIDEARIGELDVHDGSISLVLENPTSLLVNEASWNMGEMGRFWADPFRFDPTQPQIDVELHCADASLDDWLSLVSDDRVHGEAQLQGSMMVAIRPGAAELFTLGEGLLYAQPSSGWFTANDPEAVEALLEQGNVELGSDDRLELVRDRLVDALSDFEFSLLRIQFDPADDGLRCRIHTKGKGRHGVAGEAGSDPQEVDLTVNLNNFDLLIRAAVLGKSVWDLMNE